MTLAGIELRYLVNEIKEKTSDYYVSNIYGINRDSLLFKLHHPEKPDILLMVTTSGMWISSVKINQIEPNKLLRRLRNELLRLKITNIKQIDAERIAYITFSNQDKEFVLIGEFFGDGNLILCNKELKILAIQHSIEVRHRKLQVGSKYIPPPQSGQDVFNIKKDDVQKFTLSSTQVVKLIGRSFGLPTKYAEEIIRKSKIDPKTSGVNLNDDDITRIYDSTNLIVQDVIGGIHDPVIVEDDNSSDVYPIVLGSMYDKTCTKIQSFMDGLDTVFTKNILEKGKTEQAEIENKKIEELEKQLEEQTKAIEIVKQRSENIANLARSLQGLVFQGVSTINEPKVMQLLKNQSSEIMKEKGISYIKIADTKISLNLNSSIPSIASLLFDASKRQNAAINSIEKIMRKTEKKIDEIAEKAEVVKKSITFSDVRRKSWYERYRWFYTSDGILAVGGRDSSSNSALIRKHLDKNDKVFHADIFGSPFFLLKNIKEDEIPPASLNETAHATCCYSRAWRESLYGINAYWVNPDQIKKAAPSGQFLPKGSFVIEGKRNFVRIATLKMAVGILKQGNDFLLTSGPPVPIIKKCLCYVIIEPGGLEMVDIAKKIKTKLNSFQEKITTPFNLDDFVRVLPSGQSHMVESGLGEQVDGEK